jgi:hypothetical protein
MCYKVGAVFIVFSTLCFADNSSSKVVETKLQQPAITFNLDQEYKLALYTPINKRWSAHLSGKINPDYDSFGNELKTNVFTTLGIDF